MDDFIFSSNLSSRLSILLHQPVLHLERIQRGYTPTLRLRAWLQDGSTVFIKNAVSELTAGWLRQENHAYTYLAGKSFIPRRIAFDEGDAKRGEFPCLVLEDLSTAVWPPPWTHEQIGKVIETLTEVAGCSIPALAPLNLNNYLQQGWQAIAEDPQPFLSLGMVTTRWLEQALPVLLSVDVAAALRGDALVHRDVRSDNLCFLGNRAVLVDWNLACTGSPRFDLASWLPSLENEGGPPPETFMPAVPEYAAVISGFFAARAGRPVIPDAPYVRDVQKAQLRSALPWAVRALGLPPLDGK
jgi:hypothetical protein